GCFDSSLPCTPSFRGSFDPFRIRSRHVHLTKDTLRGPPFLMSVIVPGFPKHFAHLRSEGLGHASVCPALAVRSTYGTSLTQTCRREVTNRALIFLLIVLVFTTACSSTVSPPVSSQPTNVIPDSSVSPSVASSGKSTALP